jgi:EthD domain
LASIGRAKSDFWKQVAPALDTSGSIPILPEVEGAAMIIRAGLIKNRDGVDHKTFAEHWLGVHGPLARQVPGMTAYTQNHKKAPRDLILAI